MNGYRMSGNSQTGTAGVGESVTSYCVNQAGTLVEEAEQTILLSALTLSGALGLSVASTAFLLF